MKLHTDPVPAVIFALLVSFLALPGAARAGIAFVGLQGLGVSPAERGNLERLVTRVLVDIGGANLLTPDQVRAMLADPELDTLSRCIGQTRCLVDFGGISASHVVLTGSVAKFGSSSMVMLKLIDTLSDSEKASIQQKVGGSDKQLLAALRKAVFKLIQPDRYSGAIVLRGGVSGAKVQVDGKDVGVTPLAKPLDGLFAGTHTVTVSMMGYRKFTAMAEVDVGETTGITVDLQPLGVTTLLAADNGQGGGAQTIVKPGGLSTGSMVGSIVLAGLGVASGAVAGLMWASGNDSATSADAARNDLASQWQTSGVRGDARDLIDYTIARDNNYNLAIGGGVVAAAMLAGAGIWLWLGWEPTRVEPVLAPTGDGLIGSLRIELP